MALSPEKYFYVKGGSILADLKDLRHALNNMDEETFKFHVNNTKNDFAVWVREVLGKEGIASSLVSCREKEEMRRVLKKYVASPKKDFSVVLKRHISKIGKKILDRAGLRRKFYCNELLRAYRKRIKELEEVVQDLDHQGYSTNACRSYFPRIMAAIEQFEATLSEKDGIKTLHLFYCVEEEIHSLQKRITYLQDVFEDQYINVLDEVKRLEKEGRDTSSLIPDLHRLKQEINRFKLSTTENAGIDTLHRFYKIEDNIDNLENS